MRKFGHRYLFIIFSLITSLALGLSGCGGSKGGRSHSGETPNLDTVPPVVSSTLPANGATQVPLNVIISATFSEPINPETLSANSFIVLTVGTAGGATVSGTFGYTAETMTATFTPTPLLGINTTYTVTITTAVEDEAGNEMAAPFSWSFATGSEIDNSPPSFAGSDPQLIAQATSSSTISLTWNAANDNTTLGSQLRYAVCRSTVSTDCTASPFPAGGDVVITEVAAGQTSLEVTGLDKSTTYYFVVRAKDQVNLMDSNVAQKSATTFGIFVSLGKSLNKTFSKNASDPSIAIIGTTPYVTWSEGDLPADVYTRTFSLGAWSDEKKVNTAGNHAIQPRIASNGAANPVAYITYTECNPAGINCKIYVKRWNAVGSTWDPVGGALNRDENQSAGDSAIAFDGNSNPYVIWVEADQIYVSHFIFDPITEVPSLIQNRDSLNVDSNKKGINPAIAIDGTTIKASWTECLASNPNDCQLYVKGWDSTNSLWTPSNADIVSLKAGDPGLPSLPQDVSLAFINHVLHVSWHESAKVYVRKEVGNSFVPVVKQGVASTAVSNKESSLSVPYSPNSVSSSSNTPLGGTATSTQTLYLVFADITNADQNTGPYLFTNRWNGTEWIAEEGGAKRADGNLTTDPRLAKSLNMTGGSSSGSQMNASIAFQEGTPYIAWTEKGSCLVINGCGQNQTSIFQVYVKRLE